MVIGEWVALSVEFDDVGFAGKVEVLEIQVPHLLGRDNVVGVE